MAYEQYLNDSVYGIGPYSTNEDGQILRSRLTPDGEIDPDGRRLRGLPEDYSPVDQLQADTAKQGIITFDPNSRALALGAKRAGLSIQDYIKKYQGDGAYSRDRFGNLTFKPSSGTINQFPNVREEADGLRGFLSSPVAKVLMAGAGMVFGPAMGATAGAAGGASEAVSLMDMLRTASTATNIGTTGGDLGGIKTALGGAKTAIGLMGGGGLEQTYSALADGGSTSMWDFLDDFVDYASDFDVGGVGDFATNATDYDFGNFSAPDGFTNNSEGWGSYDDGGFGNYDDFGNYNTQGSGTLDGGVNPGGLDGDMADSRGGYTEQMGENNPFTTGGTMSLMDQIGQFLKNPMIPGTNATGGNVLGALANYLMRNQQQGRLDDAANRSAQLNDPLKQPERAPYQDAFRNLMTNPNGYSQTPFAQGMTNQANNAFKANVSKYGPGGTQFTDYLKNYQNILSSDFFNLANTLSTAGGFNQGTGGAGNSYGQLADRSANVGMGAWEGFGNLLSQPKPTSIFGNQGSPFTITYNPAGNVNSGSLS